MAGTHMHLTQEAPDVTDEQRTATIAGWQAFLDVLQQIAEAARAPGRGLRRRAAARAEPREGRSTPGPACT